MGGDHDLGRFMEPVARAVLGAPNERLSTKGKELRFGTNGSWSIDLTKGTAYSFETNEGGGVLWFLDHMKSLDTKGAFEYMRDDLGLQIDDDRAPRFRPNGTNGAHGHTSDAERSRREIEAVYDYVDESGGLLYQTVRFVFVDSFGKPVIDTATGKRRKTFSQRRPDGRGGFTWSLKGVRLVPYRLPELIEAIAEERHVFIVEGEKKADALVAMGFPATCNPMGAGKWPQGFAEHFGGARVVHLADNDDAGRKHIGKVGAALNDIVSLNLVLDLPNLPDKGDVIDWRDAGGDAEKLQRLLEETSRVWAPEAPASRFKFYYVPEATMIQPREWLYGRHYIRGTVGATIGAGGRLKTGLVLGEIVGMACGRNLLSGEALPGGPLRAAYFNGEEDQDELDRRFAAIAQHFKLTQNDIADRLIMMSVKDLIKTLKVAVEAKNAAVINQDAVQGFQDLAARCDVMAFDPLISFHAVKENDNLAMDVVVKEAFGAIAGHGKKCAVELVHHIGKPKPGALETTVEDARGASAIIAAVRSARVLNFMTPGDAVEFGVKEEDRRRHIRVTNGKANMGPIGKAEWVKIGVEIIANSDHVACATFWKPPDVFQGMSPRDVQVAQTLAQGGAYRGDVQSPQWFGWALADHLKIDVRYGADNPPHHIARLKKIIKTWMENKVLDVEERKDEQRKSRPFIIPGKGSLSASAPINRDPDQDEMQFE